MTSRKRPGSTRGLHVKVKTARGRKLSSTRWLQRQLNDPYVQRAKAEGYRSRAAYKLMELDEKFDLFHPGMSVVDLGAAPGSWTQYAMTRVGPAGQAAGIDLLPIEPLGNATFMQGDFTDDAVYTDLLALLGERPVDVVLSDMAANASGQPQVDHLRIMALCELALDFALNVLSPGGSFVAKVLQGGTEQELLQLMKQRFTHVKHAKPAASRKGSAEMYVVAQGFRAE